jgi:thiamine-phosphate pyrophosphorylase
MSDPSLPRLYLLSPVLAEAGRFTAALREACAAADVAAVLLRLAPGDERSLINTVKALAPAAQDGGAAVLVQAPAEIDAAAIAVRGGADGVHTDGVSDLRGLRERLRDPRMLGVGQLRTKHDAMSAGEAGVDYVMFGDPKPDGYLPPLEDVAERAEWWAEIFETPCVAFAPTLEAVAILAGTGAEFVALGDAVWTHAAGPAEAVRLASRGLALRATEPAR